MLSKVFVSSLLIGAVSAALREGVYRIVSPDVQDGTFVARSGYELVTPVTLALSEPIDLHELWVARRIVRSPPNYYTLENIGQSQASYATDDVRPPPENFVFTDTTPHSFYIESPNNDDNYVIYTDADRKTAWTAPSQTGSPIRLEDEGSEPGQTWRFVSALRD